MKENQLEISRSKLFEKMLILLLAASSLIIISIIIKPNRTELINNLLFQGVVVLSYIIYKFGFEKLAYHALPIGLSLLYLISSYFYGNKNLAIILGYPAMVVYYFIFFRSLKVLIPAFIFLTISLCAVIIIFLNNLGINLEQNYVVTALTNAVTTSLAIFALSYFYLQQMHGLKSETRNINKELIKNEAYIKIQKNELERKNKELHSYIESNLQLENFAHLASHELKTPVRNVLNFSNLLERNISSKLTEKEKEYFKYISDYTMKMNDLITDLHRLSSVSKSKIEQNNIDVTSLLDQIIEENRITINKKNAVIHLDLKIKKILGQENLIKQVFSNLIENALKFSRDKVSPKIDITSNEDELNWNFKISDNGIGINPKYKEKVFLIFKRLHSDSEFSGTGIGLAICKRIIELHKGQITIEENTKGGSTFSIILPKKLIQ